MGNELENLGFTLSDEMKDAFGFSDITDTPVTQEEVQTTLETVTVDAAQIVPVDDITTPHLILDKTELVQAAKMISYLIKVDSGDTIGRSVNITYRDGHVLYRNTDFASFFSMSGKTENTENVIEETISIPLNLLTKLIRFVASNVPIFKKDDNLYIRLLGGDLLLELKVGDDKLLEFPGTITNPVNDLMHIDARKFLDISKVMLPLIQDTQQITSKRILFTEDKALFFSSAFAVECTGKFTSMAIRKKDIDVIRAIVNTNPSVELQFIKVNTTDNSDRAFIKVDNLTYSFIYSPSEVSQKGTTLLNTAETSQFVTVDYNSIYNVTSLAADLTYAVGKIGLNYSAKGLDATIVSTKGVSNFEVIGSNNLSLPALDNQVMIFAKNFRKLLQAFQSYDTLELSLMREGLAIRVDGIVAVMFYI